ncbi:hypothetical protein P6U16_17550 [Rhizobium sp. 32-5/1]|uniref:hypothetical protein n=1 Tax=Rhizobium sp. 32-5/1 TaxID=3019602 RepID=UPI00240D8C4C|nr:hypothetical protein [Rhizobium sp. 32-5/1]WEZ82788.1 hypothetical protein P6U16_17550 [Rhizobium sp. 32-5/1]
MSSNSQKINNDDLSLAVIGLLTAAIVSIFMAEGNFTLFVAPLGLVLFLIAQSFAPRLSFDRYGFVAFILIQGASILCVLGYFVRLLNFYLFGIGYEVFLGVNSLELMNLSVWLVSSIVYGLYRFSRLGDFR